MLARSARPVEVMNMRLHDFHEPGNGLKVRMLLSQLEMPRDLSDLNVLKSETRTTAFRARNFNGRISTLVLDEHAAELPCPSMSWRRI